MSKYLNFTLAIVFANLAIYDLFKEGDLVHYLVIIGLIFLILAKIDFISERIDRL